MVALKRRNKAFMHAAHKRQHHGSKKRRQATQMAVVTFLRTFSLIAVFMFLLSSVINPIICLSFVNSYRRGLRNIVCCFCRIRNSSMAKRERITLKEIKTFPAENCQWTAKNTDKC